MDDFDKYFKRMQITTMYSFYAGGIIIIGILIFLGWVVVKLMAFWGVI